MVPNEPMENPVTVARSRVALLTNEVRGMESEVRRIADVLFGAVAAAQNAAGTPVRCGEAGMLHDAIDEHSEALAYLLAQVRRLAPLGYEAPPPTGTSAGTGGGPSGIGVPKTGSTPTVR